MSVDETKLMFWSGANYLKRSEFSSSASLALGGLGTYATTTITHNLGYIPFFSVYADLTNDGTIWSNDIVNVFTESSISGVTTTYPTLIYYCTTTTLTIKILNNTSPLATGSRTVYWTIYLDYGS